MTKHRKASSTKRIEQRIWTDGQHWTVQQGTLRRRRGRPGAVRPLFQVVAEKIPFAALDKVRGHVQSLPGIAASGVYVAHDSMGTPRYIGRGSIFLRLQGHRDAHIHELLYFSFYVVKDKVHEREIETLLIRAAGPSLLGQKAGEKEMEDVMKQAHTILQVLKCFRGYSSATYLENGVLVTHSETVFRDQ